MSHNPTVSRDSRSQRGAASIGVAMLLIFILAAAVVAVLKISGSSVIDAAKNEEQVAALFVAESGSERAAAILQPKLSAGTMTGGDCTAIATGSTYGVGNRGGSFGYLSAVSNPSSTCSSTGTPCTKCSVTVAGTVGSSTRTVKLDINVPIPASGTSGCGQNVQMTLANTTDYAATAVFQLAWRRLMNSNEYIAPCSNNGPGNVDANVNICTNPVACSLKWNVESSSGQPSGGSLGTAVAVARKGQTNSTFTVVQTLTYNRNYAEVGALFPSFSATVPPIIIGSYWDDGNGGNGTKTVNNANSTPSEGQTNSGVATSGGSCTVPSATHINNPKQLCTSWCSGADTLVFGITGRSSAQADSVTNVTFNPLDVDNLTSGIPLTRVARYPNVSGTPATTGDIYSEIWYAPQNPDYLYGAQIAEGEGSIAVNQPGVAGFTGTIINGSQTLEITSVTGGSGSLSVGDTITTVPGIQANTKIVSGSGGVGTYTMSQNATANSTTTTVSTTRHVLTANSVVSGQFAVGQTLSSVKTSGSNTGNVQSGTTIVAFGPGATGTTGTYFLSIPPAPAPYAVSATDRIISSGATSAGATVTIVPGNTLPSIGTIVTVRSGVGEFSTSSVVRVLAHPTSNSFTVERLSALGTAVTPGTTLAGAQICGGTCAFFYKPHSTTETTKFVVTRSAGTTQWAGGFVCLSGVDQSKITAVNNITPADYGKWTEVVR